MNIKDTKIELNSILSEIPYLISIFSQNNIIKEKQYCEWYKVFKKIYGTKFQSLQLYIIHSLIFFTGLSFLSTFMLYSEKSSEIQPSFLKKYIAIKQEINIKYYNYNIFIFDYFNPILNFPDDDLKHIHLICTKLTTLLLDLEIPAIFKLDFLIQNSLSSTFKHKSGEYYTPSFLARKMVEKSYFFGKKILDPCCGSGNFLLQILNRILSSDKPNMEKINAINNVYGYDVNPIAIFVAKINFLILLKNFTSDLIINLYIRDSLFSTECDNSFDVIIGNPPWFTYRDVDSLELQIKIKDLAQKLGIKPSPKNILNIEISSLFFYQAKTLLLKIDGTIFFIITKGVLTGSHADLFRNFKGFKNILIWTFEKNIEKIFNIDFICLYAKKASNDLYPPIIEVPTYHFGILTTNNTIDYYSDHNLELIKKETLVPYSIETEGDKRYIKKYVPQYLFKNLIHVQKSYYKDLFHKGADLNPRNLIFIKYRDFKHDLVKISPDEQILQKAKSPWNRKIFDEEIVEKEYLFKVVKSTEIVKFHLYHAYDVFLPLSKNNLGFDVAKLPKYAKKIYSKINIHYLNNKKGTTKHKSLMENLNRWSKLITPRQLSKIKVVYNNSGSILNSAVIVGDFLVTGDLSFYATQNLDEAYYLSCILNSNLVSNQIKIKKSSRHIFKIPFDLPIEKYNENKESHKKLVNLAIRCENLVKEIIHTELKNEIHNLSKFGIQKILFRRLDPYINEIDEILTTEFCKKSD